jgi:polyhydroxyalkanoate synthesis regulator phasin
MMKKIIAGMLLLTSNFHSTPCYAEPTVVTEKDPGEVVSSVRQGQAAPFSGVLMSPRATAKLIADLSGINEKIAIEVTKATNDLLAKNKFAMSEAETKCSKDKKVLQDEIDLRKSDMKNDSLEIDRLNAELKKKEIETPSRIVWSGIGFAGGIAITVLTVFAINKASN